MKAVKPHTAEIDPHTWVVALADDSIELVQYGQVGAPFPYFLASELGKALDQAKPRTNDDRVEFISQGRYDVTCYGDGEQFYGVYDRVTKDSIFDETHFNTWTEAVDALMDMDEL